MSSWLWPWSVCPCHLAEGAAGPVGNSVWGHEPLHLSKEAGRDGALGAGRGFSHPQAGCCGLVEIHYLLLAHLLPSTLQIPASRGFNSGKSPLGTD